ncbi:MAG: aquaporin family protein [Planctomycetaceae bacterium]|nr:aquaporin family protein [Planctomycetaceae bacterium]
MSPYFAEFLGTTVLLLLGDGVVANVVLSKTKGHGAGWIVITFGWAMAVFVGVALVGDISGAHLNPAVTVGMAVAGKLPAADVAGYIVAQMLGAMTGATLVWAMHRHHFAVTQDPDAKLGVFCNAPAIRTMPENILSEVLGTGVLVLAALMMVAGEKGLGAINALPIAFVVFAVGLCLGGTTGYAINPARDLGPRIVHFLVPIPDKRDSDWGYSWIPVVGPILGGILAALIYKAIAV